MKLVSSIIASSLLATPFAAAEHAALKKEPKRVWATMVARDNYSSVIQTEAQIRSVQEKSMYEHVTFVLPNVSNQVRLHLRDLGSKVIEIPLMAPKSFDLEEFWSATFSRFNLFGMTEYDQIGYLDNDAFLFGHNPDGIFEHCSNVDICGSPSHFPLANGIPMINFGVTVIRPSKEFMDFAVEHMDEADSSFFIPDEKYLGDLVINEEFGPSPFSYKFLSAGYNTCSEEFYRRYHSPKGQSEDGYIMMNEYRENHVEIVHACAERKFTDVPHCGKDFTSDDPRCKETDIALFQTYAYEQCAPSIDGCNTDLCHVCEDTCVPDSVSCESFVEDKRHKDNRQNMMSREDKWFHMDQAMLIREMIRLKEGNMFELPNASENKQALRSHQRALQYFVPQPPAPPVVPPPVVPPPGIPAPPPVVDESIVDEDGEIPPEEEIEEDLGPLESIRENVNDRTENIQETVSDVTGNIQETVGGFFGGIFDTIGGFLGGFGGFRDP